MDDLRWILAAIGVVIVVAIYLSGRFEREEWRRDREGFKGFSGIDKKPARERQPITPTREEPHLNVSDVDINESESVVDARLEVQEKTQQASISKSRKETEQKTGSTTNSTTTRKKTSRRSVSVGINSEEDVKKALGFTEPGKKTESHSFENLETDWAEVVEPVREPLVEDEIVDVEIPDELTDLNISSEPEKELTSIPAKEDPVQQELLLEIEPLVLVLTVMVKGEGLLYGKSIRKVLEGSGLKLDDKGIYQFHMTGKKDAVFSVVSVVEPGVFDLKTINDYETPGISFFCQLPGPLPNSDMFRIMHMKALNISEKLGGQLCDDKRNILTEQSTAHYNDRITEFDREIVLARKKQG